MNTHTYRQRDPFLFFLTIALHPSHIMAQAINLPMKADHTVARLQDNIVVFGGTVDENNEGFFKYQSYHIIWMYNLYTDLWKKYVIPAGEKTPPLQSESHRLIGVTIKTDIYVFAAPRGNLGTVWQLKRERKGFSWHEVPVKKTPSYRYHMTGWQYEEKMWIFGGHGPSPVDFGNLSEFAEFCSGYNNHITSNQLLSFDPSCNEWKNLKCSGAVPSPRYKCTSALIDNEAWVHGGNKDEHERELYNLNMSKLSWTQIECKPQLPELFNAPLIGGFIGTCSKLVLHGVLDPFTNKARNITCVLDLSSLSWREYKTKSQIIVSDQEGISGLNSCVLIGGIVGREQNYKEALFVRLEPKSLQQLAMKIIYAHKAALPWKLLPNKLFYNIMDSSPEGFGEAHI